MLGKTFNIIFLVFIGLVVYWAYKNRSTLKNIVADIEQLKNNTSGMTGTVATQTVAPQNTTTQSTGITSAQDIINLYTQKN